MMDDMTLGKFIPHNSSIVYAKWIDVDRFDAAIYITLKKGTYFPSAVRKS